MAQRNNTMNKFSRRQPASSGLPGLVVAVAFALGADAAGATDLYLKAHRTDLAVPVSAGATTTIPMWTYSRCDADYTSNCVSLLDGGGSAGPLITVPAGPLTIHLRNDLEEPTSIYIPGQVKALAPVRAANRIVSFDAVTAPGSVGLYTWTDPRAGTFLLQSGTHPQKQVQMGLHGAIRIGSPVVPAGETVAIERSLIFSEVDPELHGDGTSAGTFAANAAPAIRPVPTGSTPQGYAPRYFLLNGRAYANGSALDAVLGMIRTGEGVLLDLVNAGLETHAPELLGGEFEVTAEDGYATPARLLRSSTVLGAGKALQLLFKPHREDTYVLLDRRLRLSSGSLGDSGMIARLKVGTGGSGDGGTVVPGLPRWAAPTAGNDLFVIQEGGASVAPAGVLANDASNSFDGFMGVGLRAESNPAIKTRYGTLNLDSDGGFSYLPTNPQAFSVASLAGLPASCKNAVVGRDSFSYAAVHAVSKPGNAAPLRSAFANVDLELAQVNDAPTTTSPDFFYAGTNSGALSVTGSGFLVNDINADVDCDMFLRAADLTPVLAGGGPYVNATKTASLVSFATHSDGMGTGAFIARANTATALGVSRFTYRAADLGGLKGALGTVYAVRDAYVDVDLVNDMLSATSYKRTTAPTTNRWSIRLAARPITVAGMPKTYKLTFYAVLNGTTTLIGSALNSLQGMPASRTFTFSTPLLTAPGGVALPEHSLIGLKVVIDVPSDGTIPAHTVTLNTDIPVL